MHHEKYAEQSSEPPLLEFIEKDLMRKLPAVKRFNLELGHDYAFSDQYGAFKLAARYCRSLPFYPAPGIWQHGCFGPWDQANPGSILYHSPKVNILNVFVGRQDEREFLERRGVTNCKAIGLPFVYAPVPSVARQKNSLLVVPIHTISGIRSFYENNDISLYAKQIFLLKKKFSNVVLCVHRGDVENGYWIREFGKLGIRWVLGADPRDANSLLRIKQLFHCFEYVTTNGWGSHVPYALSCGAKCSIYGVKPSHNLDVSLRDVGAGGADQYAIRFSAEAKRLQESYIAHLKLEPTDGISDVNFGSFMIGMDCKLSPRHLYQAFGWDQVPFYEKLRWIRERAPSYARRQTMNLARCVVPTQLRSAAKKIIRK